jgi:beta-glucosidase-like glycosyl hydrolase
MEYYKKGINVALLPVAGPLGRVARGGRNWEGFGADPYLSGAGMEAVTTGVQEQGVIVQSKHWLLNEQVSAMSLVDHGVVYSISLTHNFRSTVVTLALMARP